MTDLIELAWAAGIFEGEGSFTYSNTRMFPRASVQMNDEDTVRRFHRALGFGRVNGPYTVGGRKPSYKWQVDGYARVAAVLGLLWYGLGNRRRSRAVEIMSRCRPARSRSARAREFQRNRGRNGRFSI